MGLHILSSCEALLLGTKAGVDPARLAEMLKNSWGNSRMLERNAPYIMKRQFGPSGTPLRHMVKDMAILVQLAKELGVACPECGKPMLTRYSRRGPFAGCSGYPECRKTMPLDKLPAAGTPGAEAEPETGPSSKEAEESEG